jgi:hypothetical protein
VRSTIDSDRCVARGGRRFVLATALAAGAWLIGVVLPMMALTAQVALAQQNGGRGGNSGTGASGGAGGTGYLGDAGSTGGNDGLGRGGGGGGGAAGGGSGGNGGAPTGAAGGAGGVVDGSNGSNGSTSPINSGGGGGGGGGNNGNGTGAASISNGSPLSGGSGGNGGSGAWGVGGGGGGGGGGYGAIVTGAGSSSNTSSILGGNGGAGGFGGAGLPATAGGNGGDGGVGVQFTASGATFTNSGQVTGGNGGTGGPGGAPTGSGPNGSAGSGGAGIVGSGLTIIDSGSISGGFANAGTGTQAYGIIFTGGANSIGGTGTISGGISVQAGSFAPALATSIIGTPLTFGGPLTFASGTQYLVRVSPSASDNATASSAATLTGGTVNAQFASGSYVPKQYTILTATGGLGGTTFAGLTNTNLAAGWRDSLSYDADAVYLNFTVGYTNYTGLNGNQQNVANVLTNFFNSTGGLPAQFFGLTPGQLAQIDGEAATDAEKGAFALMNQFLGLMLDPFVDGRFGGGGQPLGFAPDRQADFPPDIALAYASVLKAPRSAQAAQTFNQRWTAWGSGFGGTGTTNGNGSSNVTARDYGFAGGMDYHATPDMVYGFALAGGGTNWGLAQGLGTGRSDAFQAGVYSKSYFGPAYLAAALAFTNNWFTTDRAALGDQITANFSGQSYGGRLETGYRYSVPFSGLVIGVTPYVAAQTQWFHTPTYSETDLSGGGLGLSYNAMTANDTRSELGARFDDPTLLDGKPLILRARLAWAHDWVTNPSLDAGFESLPGASFVVNGTTPPKNSALTSAGAQLYFTSALSFLAKFDGEFAPGSQTYAGTGTLRYTW